MPLTELLQCPDCRSALKLEERRPICPRCGYQAQTVPGDIGTCHVEILSALPAVAWEITRGYAILRSFLHVCVRRLVRLRGRVLDLGSGKAPAYLRYLRGEGYQYVSADGDPANDPDILVNLEAPLPLRDASFDTILFFNVLEHLYDYRSALAEIQRVLKPGGTLYLLVPFLIKIHAYPHDYFRYTHSALQRLLAEAGFTDIRIYVSGGIFQLCCLLFNWSSRLGIGYLLYPLYLLLCGLDSLLGAVTRGTYQRTLPIGYFISCTRE